MALATFQQLLPTARKGKYAIGSFNVWDLYSTKTVVETAERLRSPVILALYDVELALAGEKQLYEVVLSYARQVSTPVAVFIDHAKSVDEIKHAMSFGLSSVMIDCSRFELAQNIMFTRQSVEIAHAARISIEGEIGTIGEEDRPDVDAKAYTDVDEARQFARETGVDALAVAIGNQHGFYRAEPKLDFDRLQAIASTVDCPLVLHGGTGIPTPDVQRAIEMGVAKVNIGAEGRLAYMTGLREGLAAAESNEKFPHKLFPPAFQRHAELIEQKLHDFGSVGQA